jgi:predicted RNase H-like nuclease (RuvC/YqgF family)
MSLQFWVSVGSLVAVIIGMISLANTLRQERRAREESKKQENQAKEKERKEEAAAREEAIRVHTEQWTKLNEHIAQMQKQIDSIDHTIGNGFAGSIKEQIKDLREACNCKMVELGSKFINLDKQVEFNTPRIEKLEDKVSDLERGK